MTLLEQRMVRNIAVANALAMQQTSPKWRAYWTDIANTFLDEWKAFKGMPQ